MYIISGLKFSKLLIDDSASTVLTPVPFFRKENYLKVLLNKDDKHFTLYEITIEDVDTGNSYTLGFNDFIKFSLSNKVLGFDLLRGMSPLTLLSDDETRFYTCITFSVLTKLQYVLQSTLICETKDISHNTHERRVTVKDDTFIKIVDSYYYAVSVDVYGVSTLILHANGLIRNTLGGITSALRNSNIKVTDDYVILVFYDKEVRTVFKWKIVNKQLFDSTLSKILLLRG